MVKTQKIARHVSESTKMEGWGERNRSKMRKIIPTWELDLKPNGSKMRSGAGWKPSRDPLKNATKNGTQSEAKQESNGVPKK